MIEQRVTLRYDAQQIPAIVQAVQGDTLRNLLQPTLTLFGHSRIGWVTYSGSPTPLVSL